MISMFLSTQFCGAQKLIFFKFLLNIYFLILTKFSINIKKFNMYIQFNH